MAVAKREYVIAHFENFVLNGAALS